MNSNPSCMNIDSKEIILSRHTIFNIFNPINDFQFFHFYTSIYLFFIYLSAVFLFFFFANCSLTGCRFTFRLLRRQQAKRYLLFLNESVFSLFFLELFIKLKILPCVLNFNLKELIGPKNLFSFGAKKSPLRGELFSCKRVILPEGDTSQTQATFYLVENLRHT